MIRLPLAAVLGLPAWGGEGNPHGGVHICKPLARGGCGADRRRARADDDAPAVPMSDERLPLPLTPTERIALEFIKAGKEPSSAALEAVMQRRWARKVKGAVEITEAGEKALTGDDAARMAMRSARRPRRR